jgi:REP element-mobilizing transposase RayT
MKNHFHLLVRIKTVEEQQRRFEITPTRQSFRPTDPTQQFSNFFNGYAKAINKSFGRTGSLFQKRFGRKPVDSTTYFMRTVCYIHCNPQIHGFVNDFRDYPYSSYHVLLGESIPQICGGEVLDWFGGSKSYEEVHRNYMDERSFNEIDQEPE